MHSAIISHGMKQTLGVNPEHKTSSEEEEEHVTPVAYRPDKSYPRDQPPLFAQLIKPAIIYCLSRRRKKVSCRTAGQVTAQKLLPMFILKI